MIPGAQSCRGPSERLQNSLQIIPKKNKEVRLFIHQFPPIILDEGCSQPEYQLPGILGCPEKELSHRSFIYSCGLIKPSGGHTQLSDVEG